MVPESSMSGRTSHSADSMSIFTTTAGRPAVVNRIGVKPALIFGMSMLTLGLLMFNRVSPNGSYWSDLFPGFLVRGRDLRPQEARVGQPAVETI
jgi:hypothetical protein